MPLNGKSLETGLVVNQKFLDVVKDKPEHVAVAAAFRAGGSILLSSDSRKSKKCLTSGGNNVDPFLIAELNSMAKLLK